MAFEWILALRRGKITKKKIRKKGASRIEERGDELVTRRIMKKRFTIFDNTFLF